MIKEYHVSENLFDKSVASINAYPAANNIITSSPNTRTAYCVCEPNTTYTISKIASKRFIVAYTKTMPAIYEIYYGQIIDNEATEITITTGADALYLIIFYYHASYDTLTESEIKDSIMVNTGSTPLPYEPYGNTWNTKSYCKATTGSKTYSNFPIVVRSREQSISSWNMKGNEQHTGTASPTSPIEINGTGDRTKNLFDKNGTVTYDSGVSLTVLSTGVRVTSTTSGTNKYKGIILSNDLLGKTFTVSMTISVSGNNDSAVRLYYINGRTPTDYITRLFGSTDIGQKQVTFTMPNIIPTGSDGIAILFSSNYTSDNGEIGDYADYIDIMINEGSTALPYEPYGYKIPISANGTALTPVYLTEQLMKIGDTVDSLVFTGATTYNIKKLVLTGNETGWTIESGTTYVLSIADQLPTSYENAICSHYVLADSYNNLLNTNNTFAVSRRPAFFIHDNTLTTVDALKTYFATQYANGTPVTVYYVIETAVTEQVTVPTIPTTSSPTTIDINTSVKPSEMSLTYDGYKICKEQKYQNNAWT